MIVSGDRTTAERLLMGIRLDARVLASDDRLLRFWNLV